MDGLRLVRAVYSGRLRFFADPGHARGRNMRQKIYRINQRPVE